MQINVSDTNELEQLVILINNMCNEVNLMISQLVALINENSDCNPKVLELMYEKVSVLNNRYSNLLAIKEELTKDVNQKIDIIRKISLEKV
jgi:uncharacterized protein YoxC